MTTKKISSTMAFAYVFAAKFQAITLIFLAWYLSDHLDETRPFSNSWQIVLYPIAILVSVYNFYAVFRVLIRNEQNSKK